MIEGTKELDSAGSGEPERTVRRTQPRLRVAFPSDPSALDQDQEWCVARVGGAWREIRFHDYDQVYRVPGLYEHIFSNLLECDSPRVVCELLAEELRASQRSADGLCVLDLGAGNGMVGEQMDRMGAQRLVGVDIIPEAKQAARRDRPDLYDDYHVLDMTALSEDQRTMLRGYGFDCLTCVAALGFGDIPTRAFVEAFNLLSPGSPVAFNINERFVGAQDRSGFALLIEQMESAGALSMRRRHRYPHRLAVDGESIHYLALVGEKHEDFVLAQ